MKSDAEKFDDKWVPEPNSGCWLWTGRLDRAGYGQFSAHGKKWRAHRFAFLRARSDLPELLDHRCDTRSCVNPAHLVASTPRENVLRGVGRSAVFARRMLCANGHPLEPYPWRSNRPRGRFCRICHNAKNKRLSAAARRGRPR